MGAQNKYLKVMADYCSTGLWDLDGRNVDPKEFDLSPETLKKLDEWCNLYETNDMCETDQPTFDFVEFDKQGLTVAAAIKEDLLDYIIVYFMESTFETIVFDARQMAKTKGETA